MWTRLAMLTVLPMLGAAEDYLSLHNVMFTMFFGTGLVIAQNFSELEKPCLPPARCRGTPELVSTSLLPAFLLLFGIQIRS
jgi:hypothetical protein